MDKSQIPSILQRINLNPNDVANIYHYGSWVYGTNSDTSDRDLMIITRNSRQKRLVFRPDYDYFHNFELHRLSNEYDVCVHSVENFELLLEKNYLLAVECLFLPDEFKIKEEIDFKKVYLEKYYDKKRLKQNGFYENATALALHQGNNYLLGSVYPSSCGPTHPSSCEKKDPSARKHVFKNLFHGIRYLYTAEQLIRTSSIEDFRQATHIFHKMKDIAGDWSDDTNTQQLMEYWTEQTNEIKKRLDAVYPTNKVKGVFEAHVTFECSSRTDETIEALRKTCENTEFKLIFIHLNADYGKAVENQLMTSSYHTGEYPSIVEEIEEKVYKTFSAFNIIRIKVEALASNEGVPMLDIEKKLFWDEETNYFEFHYKILLKRHNRVDPIRNLRQICERFRPARLHLSRNAFQKIDDETFHYLITLRLFDVGRQSAFSFNEDVISYLKQSKYPPLKVVREFIVHDTHIGLDRIWK